MLQYVVLRHENIDDPHFDLMYETSAGSMLQTWRLEQWPIFDAQEATRIRDHRRAYLEFQGDIGDGRGAVVRVDEGTCEIQQADADQIIVTLHAPESALLTFEPADRAANASRWIVRLARI